MTSSTLTIFKTLGKKIDVLKSATTKNVLILLLRDWSLKGYKQPNLSHTSNQGFHDKILGLIEKNILPSGDTLCGEVGVF